MSVQTSGGQIQVGADDFFRTDRGITWAVVCRNLDGTQMVVGLVKDSGGAWEMGAMLDGAFDLNEQEYPEVKDWFKKKFLPALNAWLRSLFPAVAQGPAPAPAPMPPGMNRFDQADYLINSALAITVNADGTLTASSKI